MLVLLLLLGLTPAIADVPGLDTAATELSPKEKIAAAQGAVTDISNGVAFIRRLLEQAKGNKASEEEQRCLQLALIPMQALYDIALTSQNSMKTAYASGDSVHADLEYRKILVAQTKTQQFMAKAMLCVGNPPGTTNSLTESNITGTSDALPDVSTDVDPDAKVPLAGTPF